MYNVAILGATGMVGQEMLKILYQRNFPFKSVKLLASANTGGSIIEFNKQKITVEIACPESFNNIHIVLSSAGEAVSRELAPYAVKAGAVVIDNTNAFRMDEDVPLVVPEVNAEAIKKHKGIIANPNCSTAQLVVVLKPLHDYIPIKRVVVATYQAVSGAGKEAVEELINQVKAFLEGKEITPKVLPKQITFNLFPHIDSFMPNDYTKEEIKMTNETKKIMGEEILLTATAVRVPIFVGHSEAVTIEFEKPFTPKTAKEILSKAKGVKVIDNPANLEYPTPVMVAGEDDVLVGRIRKDISHPCGLNLWVVGDNLRKGAALNAVQIAEKLIEFGMLSN